VHTNRNTNSTNSTSSTNSTRRSSRRARIVGRVAAVAVVAGAAFGVASSGPFDAEASAWCGTPNPELPGICLPGLDELPLPGGPVIDGDLLPDPKFPDGFGDPVDLPDPGDLPIDPDALPDPVDQLDPADPGPGEVAPENTNQAGGEDCANITACPEVTVPPETSTTTTTVPVDVEGETEVPVGELAFTGSGDTLLRLGAVLAIGGVAAVSSAAAARKRRD
jgi:hypothetical protein